MGMLMLDSRRGLSIKINAKKRFWSGQKKFPLKRANALNCRA